MAVGRIFPGFEAPRCLKVASSAGRSWHERVLLTSFQGLVNRTEHRIYSVFGPAGVYGRATPAG